MRRTWMALQTPKNNLSRVLAGYWMLADLDGTLIPTPHKANGKYVSLADAPTFPFLKKWLLLGGNICVVTTADDRTVKQVFHPLRSTLQYIAEQRLRNHPHHNGRYFPQENRPTTTNTTNPSGDMNPSQTTNSFSDPWNGKSGYPTKNPCESTLLISMYTGATLYEAVPEIHVKAVPLKEGIAEEQPLQKSILSPMFADISPALLSPLSSTCEREGKDQAAATTKNKLNNGSLSVSPSGPTLEVEKVGVILREVSEYTQLHSTTMSNETSDKLVKLVAEIYCQYFEDILLEDETPLRLLSKRYQDLWIHMLRRLVRLVKDSEEIDAHHRLLDQQEGQPQKVQKTDSSNGNSTNGSSSRQHHPSSTEVNGGDLRIDSLHFCTNLSEDIELKKKLVKYLREHSLKLLVRFGVIRVERVGKATLTANATNGVRENFPGQRQANRIVSSTDSEAVRFSGVAQVILVSIPMALYETYFQPHESAIAKLGLAPIAQPNSVIFSQMGVNKGTLVSHLSGLMCGFPGGKKNSDCCSTGNGVEGNREGIPYWRVADLKRSIALGDTPSAGDKELTAFPPMQFISLQTAHHRVTKAQPFRARHKTNKNVLYVGGEEIGGAIFLELFFKELDKKLLETGVVNGVDDLVYAGVRHMTLNSNASPKKLCDGDFHRESILVKEQEEHFSGNGGGAVERIDVLRSMISGVAFTSCARRAALKARETWNVLSKL